MPRSATRATRSTWGGARPPRWRILPDAPLAIAAVGLSDLYPHAFKVSAGSKDSFLFVDEIANPAHLLSGSFDLAFVIVYLYPLLLLALCYNVLSGEQEQGTLALTDCVVGAVDDGAGRQAHGPRGRCDRSRGRGLLGVPSRHGCSRFIPAADW